MEKDHTIAVLGCGAFGMALLKLVAPNNKEVRLWARDKEVCDYINRYRYHPKILPTVELPKNILATHDLTEAVFGSQIVFMAIPMVAFVDVLHKIKDLISQDAILISTTKGIDAERLLLPCDIISLILEKKIAKRAFFLSGPSFAEELALLKPTAMILAGKDHALYASVKSCFNDNIKLFYSSDSLGVCLAGALKNVLAIACGVCLGLSLGKNALASLISLGLAEIRALAKAMGAKIETIDHLAGIGDVVLSCTDSQSRNFRLGIMLASNKSLDVALQEIKSVVEGVNTAKAIPHLVERYKIKMPICMAVYQMLYQGLLPNSVLSDLFRN